MTFLQKHSGSGRGDEDEEQLVNLARKGDSDAVRQLYDSHAAYLTAVCSRYMADREDARDVLQDAFVKIFGGLDKFRYRGEGSFRAWCTRIVINGALKALRRRPGLVGVTNSVPDIEDGEVGSLLPDLPPEVLQQMIKELPDGYRTVFNLYVFEQLSHKEIASMLGIRADSSASQYSRARALLARKIKDYVKENG